jgi:hypothetical protein
MILFRARFLFHLLEALSNNSLNIPLNWENINVAETYCFDLLNKVQLPARFAGLKMIQILQLLTGIDFSLCPCCKIGHMQIYKPPEA